MKINLITAEDIDLWAEKDPRRALLARRLNKSLP